MSTGEAIETSLVVSVSQITDGEVSCHCGKPACLLVLTDPDDEPWTVCYEHAMDQILVFTSLVTSIFGPKGA